MCAVCFINYFILTGINLTSICEEELTEETIDDLVSEFYHQWSSFGRVGRGADADLFCFSLVILKVCASIYC